MSNCQLASKIKGALMAPFFLYYGFAGNADYR
ncbi:hypothetical protein SHAM105786_08600 [Shewanella amazonensis]